MKFGQIWTDIARSWPRRVRIRKMPAINFPNSSKFAKLGQTTEVGPNSAKAERELSSGHLLWTGAATRAAARGRLN